MSQIKRGDIVKCSCYIDNFQAYVVDTADNAFLLSPINPDTGEAQERCIWVYSPDVEFVSTPTENRYERTYTRTEHFYHQPLQNKIKTGKVEGA
jgi:hypothetical protein